MTSSTFPFFRHSEISLHAILPGCEIPVKSKPPGGPVHLCGKEALESLYRPARDKQGGEGKEELEASNQQSVIKRVSKENSHARPTDQ